MQDSITSAIGIDFGGTSVKIGVARGADLLHVAEPITTASHPGSSALIAAMVERVNALKAHFPDVKALGCGVPGLVDFDNGFVHELTNVPGWNHVPLRDILQDRTRLHTVIENDANAMTYAEWRYGAGRGMRNVVAMTLGTGVGGGLILDNKMFRGSAFAAGEIGQMSIDCNGKPGHYGNHGALEKYMGNNQIAEHAVMRYAEAGIAKDVGDCRPKEIAIAAQNGDAIARQIWAEVADWLGTALASIAWLINPDAFIIGGGIAKAGPLLFDPLERKVRSMLSTIVWENLKILPATFSNSAGIIGNAALAADLADAA